MISLTSAGFCRSSYISSQAVFCAEFEKGGLMAAVGCRKSAIFGRGSNLRGSKSLGDKKNMKICNKIEQQEIPNLQ